MARILTLYDTPHDDGRAFCVDELGPPNLLARKSKGPTTECEFTALVFHRLRANSAAAHRTIHSGYLEIVREKPGSEAEGKAGAPCSPITVLSALIYALWLPGTA
ncbi:hypothetical protein AB0I53_18900 [Saccharopolyspora sp. NPDC050389]|uniref:hypothetical protein n=1 Tax=Saccharopolyspora sp. NPDC050389 TaxID=3155516 RepID=UPI00340F4785